MEASDLKERKKELKIRSHLLLLLRKSILCRGPSTTVLLPLYYSKPIVSQFDMVELIVGLWLSSVLSGN